VAAASGTFIQVFDATTGLPVGPRIDLESRVVLVALDKTGSKAVASVATWRLFVVDVESGEIQGIHAYDTDVIGYGDIVVTGQDRVIYSVFGDRNVNNPRVWRWRLNLQSVADALSTRLPPIVAMEPKTPVVSSAGVAESGFTKSP
jgi:hypothetical protein